MEWRIRESGHGGFIAELGINHLGGESVGYKIGFTMPAFIVYESCRFDTMTAAKRYVSRRIAE